MNPVSEDGRPAAFPRVRIITINHNAHAVTARLLTSLKNLSYGNFRVTVVDNGSDDGSAAQLARDFPEAEVMVLERNVGFGAGNNAAIRKALEAGDDYVWLLNNDCVPDPDVLTDMTERLEKDPAAGACGCVITDMDRPDSIQAWGGGVINTWLARVKLSRREDQPVDYITGCSCLFRCKTLEEVGLFDERFFLYWEDTDLCYRLRESGWRLLVSPARVAHEGSVTTGRNLRTRSMHSLFSFRLFLSKHARFPSLKAFVATAFQSAGKLLTANPAAAVGCWEGWAGNASPRITSRRDSAPSP